MRRLCLLVLLLACAVAAPAHADNVPTPLASVPGYDAAPAPAAWEGTDVQTREVTLPSRQSGATLFATEYAPPSSAGAGPFPGAVILPGSVIGEQSHYGWAATYL